MSFSVVTGQSATNSASSASSISVTLPNNPTLGNLVCVGFFFYDATTTPVTATVTDSNSNTYTIASASPSTFLSDTGGAFISYLLSAPSNASKNITVSFTRSGTAAVFTVSAIWADEFH